RRRFAEMESRRARTRYRPGAAPTARVQGAQARRPGRLDGHGPRRLGERLRAGIGRASRRALSRGSAGTAPAPAIRAHAGALNVPSTSIVENGRLAAPEKLRAAFAAGGVDLDSPIITTCGSGVTAAILVRARRARQASTGALRRVLVGMGIARRPSYRAE